MKRLPFSRKSKINHNRHNRSQKLILAGHEGVEPSIKHVNDKTSTSLTQRPLFLI